MVFYYPRHDDVHMKPGSEAQLSTLTKSWSLLAPLPLNTLNYSPHGKFTSIWETNCVCHSGIFKIIPFEQNKMPNGQSVSLVAQLCLTLCDPVKHSTPGLPVYHQFPESTQTHVHWVSDAIQPSHPLSSPLLLPSIFPSIRVFSNESALHIR